MDSEKKESFGGEEEEVVDVNNLMFDFDRRVGNSDGVVVQFSTYNNMGRFTWFSKLETLKTCA